MASKNSAPFLVVGIVGVILVTGGITSGISTIVDGPNPSSRRPAAVKPEPPSADNPSAEASPSQPPVSAEDRYQQESALAYEDFMNHFYNYPPGLRAKVDELLPGGLHADYTPEYPGTDAQLTTIRHKLEELDPYFLQIQNEDYDSPQTVLQRYVQAVVSRETATGANDISYPIQFHVDDTLVYVDAEFPEDGVYASINADAVTVLIGNKVQPGAANEYGITNTFRRVGGHWLAVI